jgi:hypothetical protein
VKKLLFTIILSVLISVPTFADFTGHGAGDYGGTAYPTRLSGYYEGGGGEFTIYDTSSTNLLLTNDAYASTTSGKGGHSESFQTFCMESDESTPDYSYMKIWVSEASVNSNGTTNAYGSGSHAWNGGSNTNYGDNLDFKTAWLYTQFATGNLYNYAYSGSVNGLNREKTAEALQWLIWDTEGESKSSLSLNSTQNTLVSTWNSLYSQSGWTGIGDVRILQCYTSYDNRAQDFLYLMTPVPVPGAVLLGLLGMAVAGAKLRKFA